MVLIVDSGSTKTTWSLIHEHQQIGTCVTTGINPFFLGTEEILHLLDTAYTLPKKEISSIYFYGAGCALPEKKQVLLDAFSSYFDAANIEIHSDLLGAARSLCQRMPGIACILGTGSNSCLYDGKIIVQNVPPLGFILGDEGSGAILGKKLVSGIFKNQFSEAICKDFFINYDITLGEILDNTYRQPFPNRFLAQYAKFVSEYITYPEMNTLVEDSFQEFFQKNVMQYAGVLDLPVHFTGSIAFFFKNQLEKVARSFGLTVGNIVREPMQGLLEYHMNM